MRVQSLSGELHVERIPPSERENLSDVTAIAESPPAHARMETSQMGAGYYLADLWGGPAPRLCSSFCLSRTYGKIRALRALHLAQSGLWLLWVISTGMQWNGAWILPEPATLCWAPSLPHRNEEKKRRGGHGSTSVVASQMAEPHPPTSSRCSSESRPHKIFFSSFLIAFGGLLV